MFYKVIYLNFWGELSTVYQEEKEDADYCAKLIKEAGLKVLGITKTKTKNNFRQNRKNRAAADFLNAA